MKHPYRIREIAAAAGLSQATVDRVLHDRGGVRESTVREVHQAIAALDRRQSRAPIAGRTFTIDVIAPDRARPALERELPALRPAVIRARYHPADADDLPAVLARVGRSRSQGLILDAPDTPAVTEAVGRLSIPVVTLGADLPAVRRVAHVGIDDAEAGATAAYLVEQWLADRAGDVLVVRGPGGAGPESGFRAEMRALAPNRRLFDADPARARRALAAYPSVRAVYAPGRGGTAAVIEAFAAERRNYDVFVAHDLTAENAELLRARKLSAVLHHDLGAALRTACLAVMRALGALPGPVPAGRGEVRVITPSNIPG